MRILSIINAARESKSTFIFGASLGSVLGISLLLASFKTIILIFGLIFVFLLFLYPQWSYLSIVAVIPFSLEIGGGLTVSTMVIPLAITAITANALVGRERWPFCVRPLEARVAWLYFLTGFVSVLFAVYSSAAMRDLSESVLHAALFFTTLSFVNKIDTLNKVIWIVILIGLLEGILSIMQVHFGVVFSDSWRESQGQQQFVAVSELRAEATTAHPLLLAIYFQLAIPFVIAKIFWIKNNLTKLLLFFIALLMLYGWYKTYARSSAISFIVMFLVAMAMSSRFGTKLAVVTSGFLLFLTYLFIAYPDQVTQIVSDQWATGISNSVADSMNFRIESWVGGWYLFLDNILHGVGYGQAAHHYMPYLPGWTITQHHPLAIHNAFIEIASERGIIAICSFLLLIFWAMRHLLRLMYDPILGKYSRVLIIILVGQIVVSLVTPLVREIWLTLGLAFALQKIHKSLKAKTLPESESFMK